MVKLEIGKSQYHLRTKWKEIPIRTAAKIAKINFALNDPERFEWDRVMAEKAHEAFELLVDEPLPGKINPVDLEVYFRGFIAWLVYDLQKMNPQEYSVQGIKKFEFKGETFFLPPDLKIEDGFIPAYKETAEVFTEASDLLQNVVNLQDKGLSYLPALAATYCRKKGEKYSDEMQLKRAELFEDLTMDIGWEVFFWACKSSVTLGKDLISRNQQGIAKPALRQRLAGWMGLGAAQGYIA